MTRVPDAPAPHGRQPSRREVIAGIAAALLGSSLTPRAARAARAHGIVAPATADLASPLHGTIVTYQSGRARGTWNAVEVTTAALALCESRGRALRAIDVMASDALAAARESDARAAAGRLRGPLDGVPLFAKSIYDVRGTPTTASSRDWATLFPGVVAKDSLEVTRLRNAGAVILGKTAADDFAYEGNGTSSLTGQVLNPHDRAGLKTPGGSSAGSAVAVLTGMAFAALGTDDGGSNRIPAGFSGVVGVKPTFGLVPRTGVLPTWPYLDTHGPLARTVADAALMLDAIAGPDASDPLALTTPWRRGALGRLRHTALEGARLGRVDAHLPLAQMTGWAQMCWHRAEGDLIRAGARVDAFTPSVTRWTVREQFAESARARGDVVPDPNAPAPTANALRRYFEHEGVDAREAITRGLAPFRKSYDVLPADPLEVLRLSEIPMLEDPAGRSFARSRAAVVARLADSFEAAGIEAMVYPTMPFAAPNAKDEWPDIRTPLGFGNWMGLPEVSVPAGRDETGMPTLNLSFVGLPGSDARILELAHAYERASQRFVIVIDS